MRKKSRPRRASSLISRRTLLGGGFVLFSLAVLFLTLRLLAPFTEPLTWAAVITVLVYPVHRFLLRVLRRRAALAALVMTAFIALGGIAPAVLMVGAMAGESRDAYVKVVDFLRSGGYHEAVHRLSALPSRFLGPDLSAAVALQIETASRNASETALRAAADFLGPLSLKLILNTAFSNLPKLGLSFLVFFISLFFFLKDGASWLKNLRNAAPLDPRVRVLVMHRLTQALRGVLYGLLFAAALQALLLSLGFWIFGVPFPLLFGVIAFFTSLVPVIGPTVLWIPAGLWLYFQVGSSAAAVGLLVYGVVIISPIDAFLKPYLIGERTRLPVLLMIIAILGGLISYGPLGLFLGPMLIGIGVAVARVYREIRGKA